VRASFVTASRTRRSSGPRRLAVAGVIAGLVAIPAAGTALGASDGCAAAASGWSRQTVAATAARIWPGLVDPSPWPGGLPEFELQIATEDENGDGSVCLLVMWGDDLNPKSHWYKVGIELFGSPVEQFFVRDNTGR
jgi:hypothetical protein